jgi:hypothetical protein
LPIFWVFKNVTPDIYQNDVSAIRGIGTLGGAPASIVLNYQPGISDTNRATSLPWAASVGIAATPGVTWLDEYPFASTAEGGAKPGLRVAPVRISDQRQQSKDLTSFYTQNTSPRFGSTFMFLVVPVP